MERTVARRAGSRKSRLRHHAGIGTADHDDGAQAARSAAGRGFPPEQRLEVEDRRSIDRFHAVDRQPSRLLDAEHGHPVQSDWVRAIGGPCGKDTGHRIGKIVSRVHAQRGALTEVQPCEHEDVVAGSDPFETVRVLRQDLDDRLAPAAPALLGRLRAVVE